jgi:hypothetical protein
MPACGSKPGLDSRLRGNDNGGPGCWHHKMMKMGDIELAVSGSGLVSGSVSIRGGAGPSTKVAMSIPTPIPTPTRKHPLYDLDNLQRFAEEAL